ncbi:hypothetical protein ABW20_dc0102543 [Dactylellina cionopaga]|nr:hypothetical protein ABW20_dc0102543 [Dactylellina cionopaga]
MIYSKALRDATASERLSLPEEYAMQKSWREDADKLTFILCLPSAGIKLLGGSEKRRKEHHLAEGVEDAPEFLIGDVNLFLYEDEDEDEEIGAQDQAKIVGEIELMIARTEYQGQGLGKIAVLVFMFYVLRHQGEILRQDSKRQSKGDNLGYLRVKIGKENSRSLGLFQKLGFEKWTKEPNYFGEWELRLKIQPQEEVVGRIEGLLRDCGVEWIEEVGFRSTK